MKRIVFAEMAARVDSRAEENKKTGTLACSRIMEAAEKVGVATISGYIGYGTATVDELTRSLEELKNDGCTRMEIVINSMGGDLFEACGMYDMIKGCGMEVTAKVYGVAASAATLIACAAARVLISENSRYMIHRAKGCAYGTVDEIAGYLDDLKSTETQIVEIYAARTGKGADEIINILTAETWMNAETSVKEGWCDEVISTPSVEDEDLSTTESEEGKSPETEEKANDGDARKAPQNRTVVRRMMQAVGITRPDSQESLERELARLVRENEALLADNDGFRGMQSTQARVMAAHEAEFKGRVQREVIREMASMGVSPSSLPSAGDGVTDVKQEGMTNQRLREMSAEDAMKWIRSHPCEAASLAGGE